jgi:hypothetical protein
MIVFLFVKMDIGTLKAGFQLQLKIMKILHGLWKMGNSAHLMIVIIFV